MEKLEEEGEACKVGSMYEELWTVKSNILEMYQHDWEGSDRKGWVVRFSSTLQF